MTSDLTWQEAKESTQEMEREIAGLIPEEMVVGIDQQEKGMLLSCSTIQHNWNGAITVTLAAGVKAEPIVKSIETHYLESRFEIGTRRNIVDQYEVHLVAEDNAENYIVAEDFDPDQVRIASGSACFTLPEGVYPGGNF